MSSTNLLSEIVNPLERDLGLREGFFVELQEEDDWSFVIQGHAFLEAAFSHIITRTIGNDALKQIITNLELSNPRTGKVAVASALGLLSKEDRRFIRWFSELRNRIVHDVTQTRFDLAHHISSLDSNQRRSFINAVSLVDKTSESEMAENDFDTTKYYIQSPKEAIWVAIMVVSGRMYFGSTFPMVLVLLILLQGWINMVSKDGSNALSSA